MKNLLPSFLWENKQTLCLLAVTVVYFQPHFDRFDRQPHNEGDHMGTVHSVEKTATSVWKTVDETFI